ncbi:hypothetical protein MRB53_010026 [Persea americana]|uniref:Uncharacterized protein n=1 Tax=Persea americana TaxID=3435 RepID=A0ACC2LRT6_PERAE|nr:hypothetical protein MRB53_010026 [Persea americana]
MKSRLVRIPNQSNNSKEGSDAIVILIEVAAVTNKLDEERNSNQKVDDEEAVTRGTQQQPEAISRNRPVAIPAVQEQSTATQEQSVATK